VTNANSHISKIIDLIAESVETDENERVMRIENLETEEKERILQIEKKALEAREKNPMLFQVKNAFRNVIILGLILAGIYFYLKFFFGFDLVSKLLD
jgi:hypothetical protein